LLKGGYEVVVLTRSPRGRGDSAKEIAWDAKSLGDWTKLIDGAEVVINLAGKSVDLASAVAAIVRASFSRW
jgi:uncharacterized protein